LAVDNHQEVKPSKKIEQRRGKKKTKTKNKQLKQGSEKTPTLHEDLWMLTVVVYSMYIVQNSFIQRQKQTNN